MSDEGYRPMRAETEEEVAEKTRISQEKQERMNEEMSQRSRAPHDQVVEEKEPEDSN